MDCKHTYTTHIGSSFVCADCLRIILNDFVGAPNNAETRNRILGVSNDFITSRIAQVGDYITLGDGYSHKVVYVGEKGAYIVAGTLHVIKHGAYRIETEERR